MNPNHRLRLRSITALATLVALIVGVPVVLIATAGWPLPAQMPDFDRVRTALVQGDIPANVVLNIVAIIVWVLWLQVAWATVWELTVNAGRLTRGQRPRRGPLLAPSIHTGVARLVAVAFSVALATATPSSAALNRPVAAAVLDADTPGPTPTLAPIGRLAEPPEEVPLWIVDSNDSLWHISEAALGDGSRAGEILDLNPSLTSARDLRPGQRLQLPSDATIPTENLYRDDAELRSTAPPDRALPPSSSYLPATEVTIAHGDNLWNLAEERLAAFAAVAPSNASIAAYLERVIEANAQILEDPDRVHRVGGAIPDGERAEDYIYPGEIFSLPALGSPPPDVRTPEPAPRPSPDNDDTASSTTPATVNTSVPATSVAPQATTARTPAAAAPFEPPTTGNTPVADDHRQGSNSPAHTVAGITGAVTLATALLALHRRRRARRATGGARHLRQRPTDTDLERALIATADAPLLQWLNHELTEAFASLDPNEPATPAAVELSTSHGIEILWDRPNHNAPHPWIASDGAWSWRLTYDPDRSIPLDPCPPALPGLVTIGTHQGRQLLIDLEALPTLAIRGPAEAATNLLRSILTELAVNDITANTYVHLAGIEASELESHPRAQLHPDTDFHEVVTTTTDDHAGVLDAAGLSTTFQLRRRDPSGRELVVIATDHADAALTDVVPHRGVAVVTSDPEATAAATITITDDGETAILEPLGITFAPAALPSETSQRCAGLLTELNAVAAGDDDNTELPPADGEHEAVDTAMSVGPDISDVDAPRRLDLDALSLDLTDTTEEQNCPPTPPPVVVCVLGTPSVSAFPALGRLETSLVAFLACSGGSATDDQVVDAVWGGRLVERSTVWNRISKARSVLGHLLPQREQGSHRIALHPDIGTDLDHFARLAVFADGASTGEAIESLRCALDLVAGVPFDAPGYDWAHQHQHHARACELIEESALRLADLALAVGDLATARSATAQALRALPGNEPLYRVRMRIEAAADNPAGVRAAYDELLTTLADWPDGDPDEPSATTTTLLHSLVGERSAS